MFKGTIEAIHIARAKGASCESLDRATLVAGKGIEGDRHFGRESKGDRRNVSFIEAEAIEAIAADYEIELAPGESRRNVTTRGVPLNHLVGRRFRVGAVQLQGVELCEPCKYVSKMLGKDLLTSLKHRGGLRAAVIEGGEIERGDAIELL